jgi:hypothetical protein
MSKLERKAHGVSGPVLLRSDGQAGRGRSFVTVTGSLKLGWTRSCKRL